MYKWSRWILNPKLVFIPTDTTIGVLSIWEVKNGICGSQNNPRPQDVYIPTLQTWEYVRCHGKDQLKLQVKLRLPIIWPWDPSNEPHGITRILSGRGKQKKRTRERPAWEECSLMLLALKMAASQGMYPLEAREEKEILSSLEPPEGMRPTGYHDVSPVRLILDFWLPEP